MLRLAHRILTQDQMLLSKEIPTMIAKGIYDDTKSIRKRLPNVPLIIADNVSEYVDSLDERGKLTFDKLPAAPMPFNECFIEWESSGYGISSQSMEVEENPYLQQGCYLRLLDKLNFRNIDGVSDECLEKVRLQANGYVYASCKQTTTDIIKTGGLVIPVMFFHLLYDKEMKLIRTPGCTFFGSEFPGERSMEVLTVAMTLGLMQCKNVEQVDVTDIMGPSPKWCRRQRVPHLRYSALLIDSECKGKSNNGERKTLDDRSGKALHICRGHFVTYIDDGVSKGLFGKGIYGTFWIPAHTRGSLKEGKVNHIYTVKAPK